ncbi:hypothetical protein [Bradyrhizobium sp. DOA1]|uniref:hypothetical protein n=1 Tax=Bradyrhizobium sp. DOA1 TaxID=1126616 RepID=UPI00077C72AD|nr:hypothetical protein [Bradyrhizobium sp. DOA1]KYG99151.1 hypothetical protein SE91_12105 [Bradyrhizobium sp. DOA1]
MTDLELDAYAKLVSVLTLTVRQFETARPDELPTINESNLPPPFVFTWYESLMERSLDFLWRLKIFRSLDKENRGLDPFFKFDCNLDDVPIIAKKHAANGPTLDSLVWLYIELRSEYNRMHLDRSTLFFLGEVPAFSISEDEKEAFKALEELGYVKAVPGGYATTAKTDTLLSKPWWDE